MSGDLERVTGQRDRARSLAARLEAQLAQVAALHQPYRHGSGISCRQDVYTWPCPTALALDPERAP